MEEFGPWAWNDREHCWSGAAEVRPGQFIALHLRAGDGPEAFREAASWFLPRWEWFRVRGWGVQAFLANELHEELHAYSPEQLCPEDIAGRLTLLSAAFEPGGVVELCYHDGMLCGGQRIVVSVGPDGFADTPSFVS